MKAETSLYRRVLGADFDRLPPAIRELHESPGPLTAVGRCRVERGRSLLSRLVGAAFAMPRAGAEVPVEVTFTPQEGTELWQRRFGEQRLTSRQALAGLAGHLVESFGLGVFLLEVPVSETGLDLRLKGARLFGLPLPRFLWPRIQAGERVEAGRFTFRVEIVLPLGGLLIRYRGYLVPKS